MCGISLAAKLAKRRRIATVRSEQMKRCFLAFFLFIFTAIASAEPDIWHELLHRLQLADTNRARLEFECKNNSLYQTMDRLIALCEKRNRIPDHVFEEAALPYLMRHLSEPMAKRALDQVSSATWQSVGRKLIVEIATGKRDQLTEEDIAFLERENQTEVGKALSAFATDKEQGLAVARAALAY